MKSSSSLCRFLALVVGLFIVSAVHAQACAVCMGADFDTGEAINGAIFLMLGFLAAMFIGIGAVAFSFYRRRHNLIAVQPPFAE
jgi:hypothetical protein